MKINLSFKTPDVAEYALEDLSEDAREEAEPIIEKFVEYGESIYIEIDSETELARVVPLNEDPNATNFRLILELSNAHAPNAEPDFGKLRVESHKYGWIVWVSDEAAEGAPDWITPILWEARSRGCALVLFDQDAPYFDGLVTYHW